MGMRIGNCLVDEKMLDSFATLGLEPTGNLCEIQRAYRDTVRMVHPDRVRRLGVSWTKDECTAAFEALRSAYEYLRGQLLEIDLPDYDIPYANDCDSYAMASVADNEEFNRRFEEAQRNQRAQGDNGDQGYPEYGPQSAQRERTLEELIAERDLPISQVVGEAEAHELVPWFSDTVAESTAGYAVIGGDAIGGNPLDLGLAYGTERKPWGECVDYSLPEVVPREYSDFVPYSEEVSKKVREHEEVQRDLEIARRKRVELFFLGSG